MFVIYAVTFRFGGYLIANHGVEYSDVFRWVPTGCSSHGKYDRSTSSPSKPHPYCWTRHAMVTIVEPEKHSRLTFRGERTQTNAHTNKIHTFVYTRYTYKHTSCSLGTHIHKHVRTQPRMPISCVHCSCKSKSSCSKLTQGTKQSNRRLRCTNTSTMFAPNSLESGVVCNRFQLFCSLFCPCAPIGFFLPWFSAPCRRVKAARSHQMQPRHAMLPLDSSRFMRLCPALTSTRMKALNRWGPSLAYIFAYFWNKFIGKLAAQSMCHTDLKTLCSVCSLHGVNVVTGSVTLFPAVSVPAGFCLENALTLQQLVAKQGAIHHNISTNYAGDFIPLGDCV